MQSDEGIRTSVQPQLRQARSGGWLAALVALACLLAPEVGATGTDYLSFWSGDLRIHAQEPDTQVTLIDVDTGLPLDLAEDPRIESDSLTFLTNPFTLSNAGDAFEGIAGLGAIRNEMRIRILTEDATGLGADKPVTVWVGALNDGTRTFQGNTGDNPWMSYLPATTGSELGRRFVGFTTEEVIIVARRSAAASVIEIEDLITNTDADDDDSITLTAASPERVLVTEDIEVYRVSGFEDDTLRITANVDVSVLVGFRPDANSDWSVTPPSFAVGEDGLERGTEFYTYTSNSMAIFPLEDDTTVTVTDLSDGDDSGQFLLSGGDTDGPYTFYSKRPNASLVLRGVDPAVEVIGADGNAFDEDYVKVEADKPVLVYVGPLSSNLREYADVAFTVPTGPASRIVYAYAQNGDSNDLQIFAFDADTQVSIRSLTSRNVLHDFEIGPGLGDPTGWIAGTVDGPVWWGADLWSGEVLRIESDRPISVINGDYDQAHFGAFLPFVTASELLPPVARASNDLALATGDVAIVSGAGSFDQDAVDGGEQERFEWDADVLRDSSGDGIPDNDIDFVGPELPVSARRPGVQAARLTYFDDDGQSDEDFTVITVSGPAAVDELACRPKSDRVQLTWSEVPDAVRYRVFRHRAGQSLEIAATTDPLFLDSRLALDNAFTYTVRAQLPDGQLTPPSNPCAAFVMGRSRVRLMPVEIASQPPVRAIEGAGYEYRLAGNAAQPLTYALAHGPDGLDVTPQGLVRWQPDAADVGFHVVTVTAGGAGLRTAVQTWLLTVAAGNRAPQFLSSPVTAAVEGNEYVYQLEAVDPDPGAVLRFSVLQAPDGFRLVDASRLSWVPGEQDVGITEIRIRVTDRFGAFSDQRFDLAVANQNDAPQITSNAVTSVDEGALYTYQPSAVDTDTGDLLRWSLLDAPAGMTIDPLSGAISWQTSLEDAGSNRVELEVRDALGLTDSQTFRVRLRDVNFAPEIVSTPLPQAGEGVEYRYPAVATDADADDVLIFSLDSAPVGMSVDADTGLIRWIPQSGQLGPQSATLRVMDQAGAFDLQDLDIRVFDAATLILLPAVTGLSRAEASAELDLLGLAALPAGGAFSASVPEDHVTTQLPGAGTLVAPGSAVALTLSLGVQPTVVPDLSGRTRAGAENELSAVGLALGEITRATSATRLAGRVFDQFPVPGTLLTPGETVDVTISDGRDAVLPVVRIDAPPTGTLIGFMEDVIATVEDENLDFLQVDIALSGSVDLSNPALDDPDWRTIATGSTPVDVQQVGRIDATVLANDSYAVRVLAVDEAGNRAAAAVVVGVTGDAKIGEFRLEFIDLALPIANIPIEIRRIYETTRAGRDGELGFGWRLQLSDADIRETEPVADNEQALGLFGANPYRGDTRVYLNAPDGRRIGFDFTPRPTVSLVGAAFIPEFTADPGVFYELEVDPVTITQRGDGSFALFLIGFNYNPENFRLIEPNGTTWHYNQFEGLRRVTDRQGNELVYRRDGIFHSSGVGVTFERDARGRITSIIDPNGNALRYDYDDEGNLASFTQRNGLEETYGYLPDPAHYLGTVTDANGSVSQTLAYDEDGRLSEVTDALGERITQDWEPETFTGVVTDARGGVVRLLYDPRGNIIEQVDQEGGITTFAYDADDNVISQTDPNGNTTTFTRDRFGNVTSETDGAGNVSTFTFDAFGNPSSVTNANGEVASSLFDADGNLTEVTLPDGAQISLQYDGNGRLVRLRDAVGNETTLRYTGAYTVPTEIVAPDGTARRFDIDSNGLIESLTDEAGVRVSVRRDAAGRVVERIDADGNRFSLTYDGVLLGSETDPLGNVQRFEYDELGRLVRVIAPDGSQTRYGYDANGNLTSLSDALGNTTTFVHDGRDRLVERIDANGRRDALRYDGADNLIEIVDRRGLRRTFGYDAADRLTLERWFDASGDLARTFTFTVDGVGNPLTMADDHSVLANEFDGLNRLIRQTSSIAGGPSTTLEFTYDGSDNLLAISDGTARQAMAYDARNLLRELDLDLPGTDLDVALTYDERGLRSGLARREAGVGVGSSVFRFDDRRLAADISHSLGGFGADFSYQYDAASQLAVTQQDGEEIVYTYDALGQLLSADRSVLPDESYRYDPLGNPDVPGARLDVGNRLIALGDVVFGHDEAGNVVQRMDLVSGSVVNYRYDHRNRLVGMEARDATGAVLSRSTHTYDAMDRRIARVSDGSVRLTTFVGEDAWADADESGAVTRRYLNGPEPDEKLARISGNEVAWYLNDRQRSVRAIVDGSGTVRNTLSYDSFGAVIAEAGGDDDRFAYTGRELDRDFGVYDYRARTYDPSTRRFLSEDPVGFAAADANLYRYVFNDPLQSTDPSGEGAVIEYASLLCGIAVPNYGYFRVVSSCLGDLYDGITDAVVTQTSNPDLTQEFNECVVLGLAKNAGLGGLGAIRAIGAALSTVGGLVNSASTEDANPGDGGDALINLACGLTGVATN